MRVVVVDGAFSGMTLARLFLWISSFVFLTTTRIQMSTAWMTGPTTRVVSRQQQQRSPFPRPLMSSGPTMKNFFYPSSKTPRQEEKRLALSAIADKKSSSSAAASASSVYDDDDATTLLENVVENVRRSPKERSNEQKQLIEDLIQRLASKAQDNEIKYNPNECLSGNILYCTLYSFTPGAINQQAASQPLWEKLSLKADNIKGQQYCYTTKTLINYAEIYGSLFHLRAYGNFAPVHTPQQGEDQSKRRTFPDQYNVNATSATISLTGVDFQLPIQGSSMLVVLYADPRIRIFSSPQASTDQTIFKSKWENAGLIVVQVRSDYITDNQKVIDLRR